MDAGVEEDVRTSLSHLESSLGNVEQHLAALFQTPLCDFAEHASPLENAKLWTALAYALDTLFYSNVLFCAHLNSSIMLDDC